MNFQNLSKIEPYMFYLDLAFSSAKTKGDSLRSQKRIRDKIIKAKVIEKEKIRAITDTINKQLSRILRVFPVIDELHPFYRELVMCTIDYYSTKKALGAVSWVLSKTHEMSRRTILKINKSMRNDEINKYRQEFYGRISSLFKQIKTSFMVLEESRKIMKIYPSIKTSLFTVAIAGFPNIGKTTLLYKLTGSKPEIDSYAFTTRSINIGYFQEGDKRIQVLDTPGTLNRFNKMNNIEKQAYLSMRHASQLIVYIIDLTEPYPLAEQLKLLEQVKEFNLPTIVYLSKTDILPQENVHSFEKKFPNLIKNIDDLKAVILAASESFEKKEDIQEY
jgi:nucleolar GTP-binding protein